MKLIAKVILMLLCIFMALNACNQETGELTSSQKEAIQTYQFADWDGKTVSVSDFGGSVVILDFWETWCGPCLSAFTVFNRVKNEFPDDIVFIAATAGFEDGREDALNFISQNDYPFVYVDGSELSRELDISGIPYKIVINREGFVEKAQVGFRGHEGEYEPLVDLIERL
jgi:thiol-disulfide isomerase/thioredoxin